MYKIEAIVREENFEDVRAALEAIEVHGLTVFQVMGCGVQKGSTEVVRGQKVDMMVLPHIKFEIVVSNRDWADKTIDALRTAAYTGNIGDGKIFVSSLDDVIRIRTGETGTDAIN